MANVQSSKRISYHLFSLDEPSFWEPEESITFEELENSLGDGYYSQVLYGSSNGLRTWKLKMPTLAGGTLVPLVEGVNGAMVSREQYIWDLFCYTKTEGKPFVFKSPRNGQYYFARFADKELSYQKMRVRLFSTGIELKQVRLTNEAIFTFYRGDPTGDLAPLTFAGDKYDADFWLKGTDTDESGNGAGFTYHGDVLDATVNGLPVSRFNSVSNSGYMDQDDADSAPYYDIFILMKVRSGTFSSTNATVLTGNTPGEILIGVSGDTKFGTTSTSADMEYRLDGILYPEADMEAPMDTYQVVHVRYPDGLLTGTLTFGANDTTSAHMDVAEAVAFNVLLPDSTVNEIIEYLGTKAAQLNAD